MSFVKALGAMCLWITVPTPSSELSWVSACFRTGICPDLIELRTPDKAGGGGGIVAGLLEEVSSLVHGGGGGGGGGADDVGVL